jgi:hypothetical protein
MRAHKHIADLDEFEIAFARALDDSTLVHKMRRVPVRYGLLDFALYEVVRCGYCPTHLVGELTHRFQILPRARGGSNFSAAPRGALAAHR